MKIKVPQHKFNKLARFIRDDSASKYVAEKQSPQDLNKPDVQPDVTAEEIVKTRNALKRKQSPIKVASLYEDL